MAKANSRLSDRKIKSLRPKEKDYRFCCWSEILAEYCDCCGETKIAGISCCESYGLPNLGLV